MKKLFLLLVSIGVCAAYAVPTAWTLGKENNGNLQVVSTPVQVNLQGNSYPAILSFSCTRDESALVRGSTNVELKVSKAIAKYFPIDQFEGPGAQGAEKSWFAVTYNTSEQAARNRWHVTGWYMPADQFNFGVTESRSKRGTLYQFIQELAQGLGSFQITIDNPKNPKANITARVTAVGAQLPMQKLMHKCYP